MRKSSKIVVEDILNDYNLHYEGLTDNVGVVQLIKENFKSKIDLLIKTVIDEQKEKQETQNYQQSWD